MKNTELFSIAIVSFNQRPLIEACIDSILKQEYENIELIVCDDNSCDFDPKEILEYIEENKNENIKNVKVFKHPANVGTSANCQKAFELASGKYFKLQAADDMLFDEHVLNVISNYFRIETNNVLIGRAQACTYAGKITPDVYPPYENFVKAKSATPDKLFELMSTQPWGAFVCAPAVFWRTSYLRELGGFDLSYRYTEDWPLWLKICAMGHQIRYIDDITTVYRYGGISNDQSELNQSIGRLHYEECIRMLKEVSLPKLKTGSSLFAELRCWHSIKSIEARIVSETEWYCWSLKQKIAWRISALPFLCIEKLFHIRWYGLNIPFKNILKYICGIIFLANINLYLYPELPFNLLWSTLFVILFGYLLLGVILKAASIVFRVILDLRVWRTKQ